MQKTYMQKAGQVSRNWHLIDASDKVLGVLATQVARSLMGKDKKEYTPHIDAGDYVVVVNAAQVAVTGKKRETKSYFSHSNYPGGLRKRTFADLIESRPEEIIISAVKNMLPKNKLRDLRLARLKVYPDAQHKHASQLKTAGKEENSK